VTLTSPPLMSSTSSATPRGNESTCLRRNRFSRRREI
jgi:hypothetical protein